MGLLSGKSNVESNLNESVNEAKEQVDQVSVNKMRSPEELFDQVDRLEEIVDGLWERQRRMAKNHHDDINELELEEVIDNSELKNKIEDIQTEGVDLSNVEERLEMLEIAVNRLESGFEMSAEELRENIIEEAEAIDKKELERVEDKLDQLESEVKNSEIEEKVDKAELEELIQDFEERRSQVKGIEDRLKNLEIGEDIIQSEVDAKAEDLRELLVEELTSTYDNRISKIEEEIQDLTEEIGFEEINNLIDRREVEEKISKVENERKETEERLEERIRNLKNSLSNSQLEEKVDESRLESEVSRLEESIQRLVSQKENRIRDDMVSEKDLDEKIGSVTGHTDDSVSREEFEKMRQQMEQMSDLLLKVAHEK